MFKNYIFDWSGVIGDDFLACLQTINDMFKHLGVPPITARELRQEWQQPYMRFYVKRVPDLTKARQDRLFSKYWDKHKNVGLHAGIANALRSIKSKRGIVLVLTSNNPAMVDHLITKNDLVCVLDKIYYSVHDKAKKIKKLMSEMDFRPNETCIVGDTPHEVEAGRAVGITTIGVTWGVKDRQALEVAGADYIIDSPEELCLI